MEIELTQAGKLSLNNYPALLVAAMA